MDKVLQATTIRGRWGLRILDRLITGHEYSPKVTVEALEKGIQVNLYSERSCPGLLVFVWKVFEELGLNVLDARVSCTGSFQLEALGVEREENGETTDVHMVKQAILHAIENWSQNNDHQDS